jgi:type I restriction enzyme M protein
MSKSSEKDLHFEKELWDSADKLRGAIDAGEYKHIVLGLIFLKYISDSFEKRRKYLKKAVKDKSNEKYYLPSEKSQKVILEDKDSYTEKGVFFVPEKARWQYLQDNAQSEDIGKLIDQAMEKIEEENPKQLKGVLSKQYARSNVDSRTLGELINLFSKIDFDSDKQGDRDILGRVYEYFLGEFASAEGKRGGEFFTPRCLVKLLVEILEPHEKFRVFDPACGSGGMFVQSSEFIKKHNEDPNKAAFYGQEKNPTTWRLAKMNLAIRGIDADIKVGDTFYDDKFPSLRADFVLANPPFNQNWDPERVKNDPRLKYGTPGGNNANFMWIQHFLYHLAPKGMAGFVMANGALAVGNKQGKIREKIIEEDLVDVIVACPPKLFYNVQLPVSLWFLAKNKKTDRFRNRKNETLFIDARETFKSISRKQNIFTDKHIKKIANTARAWRGETKDKEYEDIPGFCKSTIKEEIKDNGSVLTPGRYVGIPEEEDDGIPFKEKFTKLKTKLEQQFDKSQELEKKIKDNLEEINNEL